MAKNNKKIISNSFNTYNTYILPNKNKNKDKNKNKNKNKNNDKRDDVITPHNVLLTIIELLLKIINLNK
jgi:hypothetical protein